MKAQKFTSVHVKVNENYTATVYTLDSLKAYCESENINPATLEILSGGFDPLAEDLQMWIDSFKAPIVIKQRYVGRKDTGYTTFSYATRKHTKHYSNVYKYFVYTQGYRVNIASKAGISEIRNIAKSKWHKELLEEIGLTPSQYERKGYDY